MSVPSARNRVRLVSGLVVFLALWVITAVGIGTTLHHRAETLDSLEHWRAKAAVAPETDGVTGESPTSRIRRLEAELETIPERLFAMGVVFALSSLFLVLGYRALRGRAA